MGGPAQLSVSAVVTVLQGSPLTSLYRDEQEGSVVMFGGVDHRYYKGELNWIPLTKAGDWIIRLDR